MMHLRAVCFQKCSPSCPLYNSLYYVSLLYRCHCYYSCCSPVPEYCVRSLSTEHTAYGCGTQNNHPQPSLRSLPLRHILFKSPSGPLSDPLPISDTTASPSPLHPLLTCRWFDASGKSLLSAPLDVCFWRAPTDNDSGGGPFSYTGRWQAVGLDKMHRRVC
jgi:Beta galactosidase small chain